MDAKGAHTSVSDLKVGGDFGGDGLHSACIAAFTQNMTIKGVAASALSLRGQHQSTVLTLVAVHMERAIKSHHSHCLILPWLWHDRLLAYCAPRGKFFVEVIYTVDLV